MTGDFHSTFEASWLSGLGGPLSLSDVEAVRLVLRGDSVIDWNRANFRSLVEVDRFFKVHLIDATNADDRRRLRYIHIAAVTYLEEHLNLRFPDEIKNPGDIRELFLLASQSGGFHRHQILACVVLKLMHVIYHMEAAELRYQIPLSEAALLDLAARRIEDSAKQLQDSGFPLVAFYGSRKARNSIITKLLAKRENIAATVFDKLRFRIVTKKPGDVLPVMAWMTRELFPYNYAIPSQSHNNLIRISDLLKHSEEDFSSLKSNGAEEEELNPEQNLFSGSTYRMINFIVDLPIRIDHMVDLRHRYMLGKVVFVMVEFQIVDEQTAVENEEGDNAHSLYKERQLGRVKARLRKGGRRWREQNTP
jgi:uncharacterized protein (TIGR04552 family)